MEHSLGILHKVVACHRMGHLVMLNNDLGTCNRHFLAPCYLLQTVLDVLYCQNAYVSHNIQGFATYCRIPNIQMAADYCHAGEMDHGKRSHYKDPADNCDAD